MENYQVFAIVYDDLMDKALYQKWFDFVQPKIKPAGKILELASGAGDLAQMLDQEGYEIAVSDLSPQMLQIAMDRMSASKNDVTFFEMDMRYFSFPSAYDAILCFDDSICYLANEEELSQTLKNAYESLTVGGKFLFDAHSLYQMDEVFPDYMFNEINDDYTFVWKSFEGEVEHSIEHDLQIFVPSEANDGQYQGYEEIHKERTYPLATYKKLIEQAGFKLVSVTSDFTDQLDETKGQRWFFECEKVE